MKFCIIFSTVLLVWLAAYPVHSQDRNNIDCTLSGVVYDTVGQPIEAAQLTVSTFDKKVIAYTFTDELGKYMLKFSTSQDSITLNVTRLGYVPYSVKQKANVKKQDVILSLASSSVLSEITVTDKRPIKEQNDTVNYSVEKFIDGSEINVEDVLAKLPGFTVDKGTGKIKYQGKEIKKILLDGDDLTDNNYKVLSKNLSADWLEEVEVLKKFSDKRLLKGIKKSDDIAINLKLKEDAKAPLFGDFTLGAGTTKKYTAGAELLSYQKKIKLFAVIESNNTGRDLEVSDLDTYTSSQLQYRGFLLSDKVQEVPLEPFSLLNQENFIFHQGYFVSNSFVTKPTSKSSLRSVTTLYNNNRDFNFIDSLFYFLPNQVGFSLSQQRIQNQKPFQIFQDLKFDYELSETSDFSSRIQFKANHLNTNTTNQTNFSNIAENSSDKGVQSTGNFSYTKKINSSWASTTDLQFGIDTRKELLQFKDNIENANDSLSQSIHQKYTNIGFFEEINGVIGNNLYVEGVLGITNTQSRLLSSSNLLNPSEIPTELIDDYGITNFISEIKINKTWKNVSILLGTRLRNAWIGLNNLNTHKLLWEPTASILIESRMLKSIKVNTRIVYDRELALLKINNLFTQLLFNSFRSLTNYVSRFDTPTKNDLVVLSLEMSDFQKKNLTANIELVYQNSEEVLVNNLSFEDDIIRNTKVQGRSSEFLFLKSSLDKYFPYIRTSFKLSYEQGTVRTPQVIENIFDDNLSRQNIVSVKSGSYLGMDINLSLGVEYHSYSNDWNERTTDFKYQKYFSKISYKPINALRIEASFQAIDFGQNAGGLNTILSSKIKYNSKNQVFELELDMNNLLNKVGVTISALDATSFSATSYPLLRRFLLLSAKFKF